MKIAAVLMCCTCITISLFADTKWIPIEPIATGQNAKADKNGSKTHSNNSWIENIKTIQALLDKRGNHNETNEEKKSWYSLDDTESN